MTAPEGATEQDALEMVQRQHQPAPSGPTDMQRIQASVPGRVEQGMRDPIDAGAQFLSHMVPDSVSRVLDTPGRMMRESDSPLAQTIGYSFFADPTSGAVDKRLTESERQYQQSRKATGSTGFDAARLTGNVVEPC